MTPDTTALRAQIAANEDAAAFYGGTPNRIILDPATVRALCDGYDEAMRLREQVVERDTRLAETIAYHDGRVNRADARTDAERERFAALVADLRALCDARDSRSELQFPNTAGVIATGTIRALVDRHAPDTTGGAG